MGKVAIVPLCVSVLIVGACGGEGGSGPSAPTANVQSITIGSSSDFIYVGASETFSATATMGDGTSRPVTGGVWGSDAPAVASVDASSGRVTGMGAGMVTVYVDYQGRRGTKLIRGLPNFQGTWSGSYTVRGCTPSGDFSRFDFCGNFTPNRVLPANFNLTQDRDRVQGRFFLGTLGGDASGPIDTGGRLLLTGAIQQSSTIETVWSLESTTPGRATGTLSFIWRTAGLSGDARVTADIRDLNRTSNSSAPAALTSHSPGATLADLLRAVEGR